MDPKNIGEIVKHLETQNEFLTETRSSISYEVEKLLVEQEMLMRKFYEVMQAHNQHKQTKKETICKEDDESETGEENVTALNNSENSEKLACCNII
ncbi:hypothetical protein CCACVL1_26509 [Corchorus capsularis]|uniref:Uncharacterized protein n=1 Tax=Corchorus capsularis TaxID=210143 RepID=A0A1R3GEI0_COCAP|nr:hypothetical protein CCACVL1_26509 [Corchorus capsularis]